MGLELCWDLDWHQVISTKCWFFEIDAQNTDFLLVGWRMSGTEFVRETIRENFPSTYNIRKWGKTHTPLIDEYLPQLIQQNTKIIFSLADPRDVAAHILDWRGGQHIHHAEDQWGFDIVDEPNHIQFLNANLNKITELYDYFHTHFGNNMLTLRYEDAMNNRSLFLSQVEYFLGETPLNIDNKEKYSPEVTICKPIGVYLNKFTQSNLDAHVRDNIGFYREWKY